MKKIIGSITVIFLFLPALSYAQMTRTWVSGVGDDVNSCSRTAPCKTFAGAISKTAAGGVIDVLDPGGFGAVTITKAITIDGGGFVAGVLVSGTNGIVINAGPNDVIILRHIKFDGLQTGLNAIDFIAAQSLIVEDCTIANFKDDGILFNPSSSTSTLTVSKTRIQDSAMNGIEVDAGDATLDDVQLHNNVLAGLVTSSATDVRESLADGNGQGFEALAGGDLNIVHSAVVDNVTGINAAAAGAAVYMSDINLSHNQTAVSVKGGTVYTYGDNPAGTSPILKLTPVGKQ